MVGKSVFKEVTARLARKSLKEIKSKKDWISLLFYLEDILTARYGAHIVKHLNLYHFPDEKLIEFYVDGRKVMVRVFSDKFEIEERLNEEVITKKEYKLSR